MIAKAAVKIMDLRQNKEVIIPCHRHHDAYFILHEFGYKRQDFKTICEGFLDEHDTFFNRTQAYHEAIRSNQLLMKNDEYSELYSEDLW